MKKALILTAVLAITILVFAGCSGMDLSGAQPQPTETPLSYDSTDALTQAVDAQKTSTDADTHKLATLDHYYGFKTLPQDTKISGIKVLSFAVRVQYTFGQTSDSSYDNRMELVWYRDTTGTDYMSKVSSDPSVTLMQGGDIAYYKAVAKAQDPADSQKTIDYCQIVYWAQDNQAYMAAVPLGFTEDDIRKYCVAQQLPVH